MSKFTVDLYYKKISSGVVYTPVSTGRPDVMRAVRGHSDYWYQIDGETEVLAPKVLVLCDSSMAKWPIWTRKEVNDRLQELLEAGFRLYIYYKESVHEITKDNFLSLALYIDVVSPLSLDYQEIIKKQLSTKGVEAETIYFLDCSAVRRSLLGIESPFVDSSVLKVKEDGNIDDTAPPPPSPEVLDLMVPETSMDKFIENFRKVERSLLVSIKKIKIQILPSITLRVRIRGSAWRRLEGALFTELLKVITEKCSNLVSVECTGVGERDLAGLELSRLSSVEEISVDREYLKISSMMSSSLKLRILDSDLDLLDEIKPYITSLEISEIGSVVEMDSDRVSKIPRCLPNIKKLDISRVNLGHEPLQRILSGWKNLSLLIQHEESGCFAIKDRAHLELFFSLSRLESLSIGTEIEAKELDLASLGCLESLDELDLYDESNQQTGMIGVFLTKSPRLTILDYYCNRMLVDFQCWQIDKPIETLTDLTLRTSGDDNDDKDQITIDLDYMLTIFPNIKKIKIKYAIRIEIRHSQNREHYKITIEYEYCDSSCLLGLGERAGVTVFDKSILKPDFDSDSGTELVSSHLPPPLSSTLRLDGDVLDDKKSLSAVKYFKALAGARDPDVAEYRLGVYRCTDSATAQLDKAVLDTDLIDKAYIITREKIQDIPRSEAGSYYHGGMALELNKHWQSLPSLSPNEKIVAINIGNKSPEDVQKEFEIKYSQSQNLYYIRRKKEFSKAKSYFISILLHEPPSTGVTLHELSCTAMSANFYKGFGVASLEQAREISQARGADLLRLIKERRVGACRHRAIAFVADYPDYSRVLLNDVHAFVEVKVTYEVETEEYPGAYTYVSSTVEEWVRIDLGGYTASIEIVNETDDDISLEEESVASVQHGEVLSEDDRKSVQGVVVEGSAMDEHADQLSVAKPQFSEELISEITNSFRTWERKQESISELDFSVKNGLGRNMLILADDNQLVKYNLYLHQLLSTAGATRPVYYISSPDDLICSAPWIDRVAATRPAADTVFGEIVKDRPGGSFYEFIQAVSRSDRQPIIIINYQAFEAKHLIRFNSLVDDADKTEGRVCDGVPIPKQAIIIGLYNHKTAKAYRGDDFYSRFEIHECTTEEVALPHALAEDIFSQDRAYLEDPNLVLIDLMQSDDWKNILLGNWEFADGLTLKDTAFVKALKEGKTRYHFFNPPKDSKELKQLLDLAKTTKRINVHGMIISIPDGFSITSSTEMLLSYFKRLMVSRFNPIDAVSDSSFLSTAVILNPGRSEFFRKNFEITEEGKYRNLDGYIKAAASTVSKRCIILVTRKLSLAKWYQIIQKAREHEVTLDIKVAEGVELPAELQALIPVLMPTTSVTEGMDTDGTITVTPTVIPATCAPVNLDLATMPKCQVI
ncbi:MAG: hypothetical protein KBC84_06985 [Proteobacteria bacterium]|nr:hypothetical protein [Pseudomonadota bacterium]